MTANGIQLRLESLRGNEGRPITRTLDDAGVSDFAWMVLFVLDNLCEEDQRRVLSRAFQYVGRRQ